MRYGNLNGVLPRDNVQHSRGRCGETTLMGVAAKSVKVGIAITPTTLV